MKNKKLSEKGQDMELPPEILQTIVAYLDIKEIGVLNETDKIVNEICNDEYLWRKLMKRDYPEINLKSMKSIYQEIYKLNENKKINCGYFSQSYGYILQMKTYKTLEESRIPLRELHPTLFKKSKYYRNYMKYSIYDGTGFSKFFINNEIEVYKPIIKNLMTCDDSETYLKEILMKDEYYYAGSMKGKVRFDMYKLIMIKQCYKRMKKNGEINQERYLNSLFEKMRLLGTGMIAKKFEKFSII